MAFSLSKKSRRLLVESGLVWLELVCTGSARILCSSSRGWWPAKKQKPPPVHHTPHTHTHTKDTRKTKERWGRCCGCMTRPSWLVKMENLDRVHPSGIALSLSFKRPTFIYLFSPVFPKVKPLLLPLNWLAYPSTIPIPSLLNTITLRNPSIRRASWRGQQTVYWLYLMPSYLCLYRT